MILIDFDDQVATKQVLGMLEFPVEMAMRDPHHAGPQMFHSSVRNPINRTEKKKDRFWSSGGHGTDFGGLGIFGRNGHIYTLKTSCFTNKKIRSLLLDVVDATFTQRISSCSNQQHYLLQQK